MTVKCFLFLVGQMTFVVSLVPWQLSYEIKSGLLVFLTMWQKSQKKKYFTYLQKLIFLTIWTEYWEKGVKRPSSPVGAFFHNLCVLSIMEKISFEKERAWVWQHLLVVRLVHLCGSSSNVEYDDLGCSRGSGGGPDFAELSRK